VKKALDTAVFEQIAQPTPKLGIRKEEFHSSSIF
jgi:hypothetical protein